MNDLNIIKLLYRLMELTDRQYVYKLLDDEIRHIEETDREERK